MTPEEVRFLYDYNSWANQRTLDACAPLSPEQFTRDMGSSFHSVRGTLVHILAGECLWLDRFQGRSPNPPPDAAQFPGLASLRARCTETDAQLGSFVGALTQADLDRLHEYKSRAYGVFRMQLWQSLQHLLNHGTYHRGQVMALLRQLGAQPATLDLAYYCRELSQAKGAANT
jgi:uncharacterized damage-inducible protein DinB